MPGDDSPSQDEDEYFVRKSGGNVLGPFDADAVRMMLESGQIETTADVSVDKDNWQSVGAYDEFADYVDVGEEEASEPDPTVVTDGAGGDDLDLSLGDDDSEGGGGIDLPTPASGDDGVEGPGDEATIQMDSPEGDDGSVDLPTPSSDDGGDGGDGLPDLPTSASSDGGDGGPTIQADAPDMGGDDDIDLPASASSEDDGEVEPTMQVDAPDLGGDGAPDLPTPKDDSGGADDGPELPASKEESGGSGDGPELPTSASDDEPTAAPGQAAVESDGPDLSGGGEADREALTSGTAAYEDESAGSGSAAGDELSEPESLSSGTAAYEDKVESGAAMDSSEMADDGGGGVPLPGTTGGEGDEPDGPELPASAEEPDLPTPSDDGGGAGGPDLPTSAEGGGGAELPTSAEEPDLPTSSESDGGGDLPTSAEKPDLPASAGEEGGEELPTSAESPDLPASAQDEELPTSAEGDDLPASAGADEGGAPPPEADEGDELLSDDEEDLFADADDGAEDDLFGDEVGGDEEDDDLFADADEGEDDLFADEGDEELLQESEDEFLGDQEDDLAVGDDSEEEAVLGEDDLSLVDEGVDADEGAAEEEAAIETGAPTQDTTGGVGAPPEEDQQEEESLQIDETAMRGGAREPEPDQPQPTPAERQEHPEAQSPEKAKEGSGGAGAGAIAGAVVLLLALGGGGAAYYAGFFERSDTKQKKKKKQKTETVSVDLAGLTSDIHPDLRAAVDRGLKGRLEGPDRGRFLLSAALYMGRYQGDAVNKKAKKVDDSLEDADSNSAKLGRGAWAALLGDLDRAESNLKPLFGRDGETAYFARLAAGMGYALLVEDDAGGESDSSTWDKEQVPQAKEGEGEGAGASTADAGSTGDAQGDVGDAGTGAEEAAEQLPPRARKAIDHLEAARSKASDRAAPRYWLGRVRENLGEPERAVELYSTGVDKQSNHVATRLRLSHLHFDAGRLEKARSQADTVLSKLGNAAAVGETAEAYHLKGLVLEARSKHEEATKAFTKALKRDPSRSGTVRRLTDAYERTGAHKEALEFFKSQKELSDDDPNVLLGMVRAYMGLERWQDAINALQRGEKQFPNDARFPFYLGKLHRERGAFSDARQAMKRAVEIDPTLVQAYGALTELTWKLDKDPRKANQYVRKIREYPDKIDASVARAVAGYYRLREKRSLAEQWYREALERKPNSWPTQLELAKFYLDIGEPKKARALLEGARDAGVEDLQLSAYLADTYRQIGQYDRALKAIDNVLEKKPENPEYLFIRGRIHFDRGNYDTARRDFNKAKELDSQFYRAYFYVGRARLAQGDAKTAIKIFRQVLDYESDVGEYHHWMGRAFEERERYRDALAQYEKATELDENYGERNPDIYVRRGRVLVKLEQPEKARKQIQEALKHNPNSSEARLAMGEAEFKAKNYEQAIEHFRTALDEKPSVPWAQYKLGQALIYQEKKREGAEHLQKAVQYGYEDPEVYQTLGYVYKELGKRQLAVESFKSYLKEAKEAGEDLPTSTRREMLRQIKELGG